MARVATVVLAGLSILLGITFKGQNVAYMVGLAFAIAASANFPALVLSIFWRRLTTAGACTSMFVGTASTLALIWLSPTIQIDVLKHTDAWFPLRNPGIVTIPLAFATAIVVSLLRPEPADAQAIHGTRTASASWSRVGLRLPASSFLGSRRAAGGNAVAGAIAVS